MDISITARHCTVPESVRSRAQERMRRLTRYDPRIASASVSFATDHGRMRAEARLAAAGGHVMVAGGDGDTFRMALDRAADRLARQLRRARKRDRDHRAAKLSELPAPATGSS